MALIQLSNGDGSWANLKADWRAQCEAVGEDPDLFAQGTFMVLDQLAAAPERRSGIYAVNTNGSPDVICQANWTPLPRHPDPVLRVRMVTVCPALDFGQRPPVDYIDVMVNLFYGIVELSDDQMPCDEIKFHLRSPEDYSFFKALQTPLKKISRFSNVEMHGAWLYVTKA